MRCREFHEDGVVLPLNIKRQYQDSDGGHDIAQQRWHDSILSAIVKSQRRCRTGQLIMGTIAYLNGCMLIRLRMKQYVIDGLRYPDYQRIKAYLDVHLKASPLDGIYWFELDKDILSPVQKEHTKCSPHVFAIMLEETSLSCELLVRIEKNIKCGCMAYATKTQRNWLIDQTDVIFGKLDICI